MNPWSTGSIVGAPPAVKAVFTSSSTSARLAHETANSPSVCDAVSQTVFLVNVSKNDLSRSITYASSLTIMQAAFSSVNFTSYPKPSLEKNSIERFRSRTGRLTNSLRARKVAMGVSWSPAGDLRRSPRREHGRIAPTEIIDRSTKTSKPRGGASLELQGQTKARKQPLDVQEERQLGDVSLAELKHDQRPGGVTPRPIGLVLSVRR